jgi:hypothetical protein
MDARTRIDFDELMRTLTVVGFVALATWALTSMVGVMSGLTQISTPATLRFLLAVLILVFARRTYWEFCEWRWKKLPADERSGFMLPLDIGHDLRGHDGDEEGDPAEGGGFVATGSPQARA